MLTADERATLLDCPDNYLLQYPKELLLSSEGRRRVTMYDPTAFALIYFRDSLRAPETGHAITLSPFHLDVADAAARWARSSVGPLEIREAWVAPRGSGKSTWLFLILPAWALAHGHRRYVSAFADNATMARNHLATFKRKVQTENKLLQKDYPDLCAPARRPGGVTDSDRQDLYLARSGATFQASGIESTTLGAKVGDVRPDLILFDDIEPPADQYSLGQMEGRLSLIREAILPMNLNAVVQFVGTVTMDGSIIHQIVGNALNAETERAPWVMAEGIRTNYYPALITGDDGIERSLWPARWTTDLLIDMRTRSPRSFAMNYMNRPVPLGTAYWSEDMFHRELPNALSKHIISLDPAVTTKRGSDYTGVAVLSWSDAEQRVCVRHTGAVKLSPADLRLHVLHLLERFPYVRMVLVETNQGGDTWRSVLHGLQVPLDEVKQSERKEQRWATSLDLWSNRTVVHDPTGQLGPFETQALAVPTAAHDDVVDAVTSGVRYCLSRFRRTPGGQPRDRVRSYAR